jgi:hypothetical protein
MYSRMYSLHLSLKRQCNRTPYQALFARLCLPATLDGLTTSGAGGLTARLPCSGVAADRNTGRRGRGASPRACASRLGLRRTRAHGRDWDKGFVNALPWRGRAGDGRQQLEPLEHGRATEPERELPGVAPRYCSSGRNDGVVIGLNVVLWRVEVDETRRVSAPQKTCIVLI